MTRFIRLLSVIMTLALLVGSANITLAAIAAELHTSDELVSTESPFSTASSAEETEEVAYIVGEDESLRKENEKHFRLSDGSYIAAVYPEAVHYLEAGEWKDIDNTLLLTEGGYANTAGEISVSFSGNTASDELFTLTADGHTVTLQLIQNSASESSRYSLRPSEDRRVTLGTSSAAQAKEFDVKSSAEAVKAFKKENPNATEEQIENVIEAQKKENLRQREYMMNPKKLYSTLEYTNILGSVDIEYVVTPTSVKENIILESSSDGNVFEFLLNTTLTPVLNDDGSLDLMDGEEIIFTMPAPYMYDSNGEVSYDVEYSVSSVRDGVRLTVTADEDWLTAEERAYPVTVDPTVTTHKSNASDWNIITEYISSSDLANFHQGADLWYMGYDTSAGNYYAYLKVNTFPVIPYNCVYVGAEVHVGLYDYESVGASSILISAQEAASSNWRSQFTGNGNTNPVIDYVSVSDNEVGTWITFDVTNAANDWRSDTASNMGLVFTATTSSGAVMTSSNYGKASFVGYNNTSTNISGRPYFSLSYRNTIGIESYYSYHTVSADRAGVAAINEHTGNLTFVRNVGASIDYVYNSSYGDLVFTANDVYNTVDYSNMKSANGWRLSLQQSVVEKTFNVYDGASAVEQTAYIYSNGDGTEHYFYDYDGNDIFNDEDGLNLELEVDGSTITITDEKDNRMIFIHGYLSQIIDSNGNITALLYDTGTYSAASTTWHPKSSTTGGKNQLKKVVYIPDGKSSIDIATLTYDSTTKYLASITDRAGMTTSFNVNDEGLLITITDSDNAESRYRYKASPYRLIAAYDAESEYGLSFTYNTSDNSAVQKYSDFTVAEVSFDTVSARTTNNLIWASFTGDTSRFRHTGADQATYTSDDVLTVNVFDAGGRLITSRSEDGDGNTIGIGGAHYHDNSATSKMNNKVLREGVSGALGQNILLNSGFETSGSLSNWDFGSAGGNYSGTLTTVEAHTGDRSAKITSSSTSGEASLSQSVELPETGTYAFSGYVKVTSMGSSPTTAGAKLAVKNVSGTTLTTSRYVTAVTSEEIDDGWVKLDCTFEGTAGTNVDVCLYLTGVTGTVYFDDIQLERNSVSSPYNLLTNGGLYGSETGWTLSSDAYYYDTEASENRGGVLKLVGAPYKQVYAEQTVNVNLPGTETYILAGWAKADSMPLHDSSRTFQLTAQVFYTDGTKDSYKQNPFSGYTWGQWQYICVPIVPEQINKTVDHITVTCSYKYNANTAYFDDISLIREAAQSYSYDNEGKVEAVNSTNTDSTLIHYIDGTSDVEWTDGGANGKFEYTYDSAHNVTSVTNDGMVLDYEYDAIGHVTGTTLTGSDNLFMTSESAYMDNGMELLSVTDNLGNTVNYTYNRWYQPKTSTTPTSDSISGNGTKTVQNSYITNSDRLYQTFVSDEIALTYAYLKGYTSSITRKGFEEAGDDSPIEQTYSFTYNALGQPLTTKVGTKSLSINTYDSATHNLKLMLYATNGYIAYTYDNLDRVKTARHSSTGLLVTYSYDYMGNVSQKKVTNVAGTIEYATYRYEFDSLGRPIRFFETLGDEIVQQVQYTYDSKNRTTSVSYFDGVKMHTESIVYDDVNGGVVTKYDYGNDGAIGYYYDGLNRVYRKFIRRIGTDTTDGWNVYYTYKGGTEANHTTSLISRLNYKFDDSNNYILNYTYDNIGNITEVTDASGNTVGRYLYDKNGQLVLEEIGNKTKVYTYDTYGNILRETQYANTGYSSPSNAFAVGNDEFAYIYGYTNSDWKDLLTSYRGQTITYDAAGNPLSYYNGQSYTFTWEDGNQLKSATVSGKTIDFTYNSDGIRTKKNISGSATYYYRLSGTKVVEMEVASVSSSTTDRYVFIYDAEGRPHEIHKYAAGATTPTKYFYVLNLQGDVIQLRDTSNAVVANYTYDAWGRLLSVKNASGSTISDASHIANVNPIRYRGYFYDTETKLYYCNSRYYDPQIKRFINADVLLSTATGFLGYNMFAYCNNNPVNMFDDSGTWPRWIENAAKVVTAVVTVAAVAVTTVAVSAFTAGTGSAAAVYGAGVFLGAALSGINGGVANEANGDSYINGYLGGAVGGATQSLCSKSTEGIIAGGVIGVGLGTIITDTLDNIDPYSSDTSASDIVSNTVSSCAKAMVTSSVTAFVSHAADAATIENANELFSKFTYEFSYAVKTFFSWVDDALVYLGVDE